MSNGAQVTQEALGIAASGASLGGPIGMGVGAGLGLVSGLVGLGARIRQNRRQSPPEIPWQPTIQTPRAAPAMGSPPTLASPTEGEVQSRGQLPNPSPTPYQGQQQLDPYMQRYITSNTDMSYYNG